MLRAVSKPRARLGCVNCGRSLSADPTGTEPASEPKKGFGWWWWVLILGGVALMSVGGDYDQD